MFKNVKIFVLYQKIGGHKAGMFFFTLKNRVGGRVGEWYPLSFNIIYIIGCSPLSFGRIILCGLGGQS
jgi:hypothetical protein